MSCLYQHTESDIEVMHRLSQCYQLFHHSTEREVKLVTVIDNGRTAVCTIAPFWNRTFLPTTELVGLLIAPTDESD